jgi:hypothetical protein
MLSAAMRCPDLMNHRSTRVPYLLSQPNLITPLARLIGSPAHAVHCGTDRHHSVSQPASLCPPS